MERGRFNDSPLKGTKLVFKVNPYVPEELRLAYKLLKDAGLSPERWRFERRSGHSRRCCAPSTTKTRTRVVDQINDRVLRLNMLWKRSFSNDDRQVYGQKLRAKLA